LNVKAAVAFEQVLMSHHFCSIVTSAPAPAAPALAAPAAVAAPEEPPSKRPRTQAPQVSGQQTTLEEAQLIAVEMANTQRLLKSAFGAWSDVWGERRLERSRQENEVGEAQVGGLVPVECEGCCGF
jgi:hypothetical protein